MNITLSMIVKNEEYNLADCLESVKDAVDEIVVVDTGSTDKTVEIAQQYGAKVHSFEWTGSFSDARNYALQKSTCNWILYMDADERLEPDSVHLLKSLVRRVKDKVGAFYCTVWGQHIQSDGTKHITANNPVRLFRNYGYPNIKFVGRIHEQISHSILNLKKTFESSGIKILHTGYDITTEELESKVIRNYAPLMETLASEPYNSFHWYNLGQTLMQMQVFNQAERCFRQSMLTGNATIAVQARSSAVLAMLSGKRHDYQQALFWAEKSLEILPEQNYGYYVKANALMRLHRFEEAIKFYEITLKRLDKVSIDEGFDVVIPAEQVLKELDNCRKSCEDLYLQ